MKKSYLFFAFLFFYAPLRALLPPLWEDVEQLKTLLDDRRFGEVLSSGDSILAIEKKNQGWLVKTNRSTIFVRIIYEEQEIPGKARYSLEFIRQ